MHRAKGDRFVRASELPVCDNARIIGHLVDKRKLVPEVKKQNENAGSVLRTETSN